MYEVKDKNKLLLFSNKKDADNYKDYLSNGLKCISQKDRTYCFNNGARLIDGMEQTMKNLFYITTINVL